MAAYVGIHTQIQKNNRKSVLLLIAFPLLVLALVFAITAVVFYDPEYKEINWEEVYEAFLVSAPISIAITAIWFLIAFKIHTTLINKAVHSHSLSRKDDKKIYNLTENLCMQLGMPMPQLRIIEDQALNAFASGLNEKSFCVTLTRGIIEKLNDEELEGVIAHELMHIRNRDVRLLVISVVFVGIFSLLAQMAFRGILYGGGRSRNSKGGGGIVIILVLVVLAYLLSLVFRFALSRKREYMADAGAADLTKNPRALASALRKISGNSHLNNLDTEDIKEMFIDNYADKKNEGLGFLGGIDRVFATHPPIEKRISVLENF
ncbi:MAG: M48 family metallopeptidase [Cryomorphaceae bacterium]|nr:M48 family metallopeptidase [Cryomorphaceae bacterium]